MAASDAAAAPNGGSAEGWMGEGAAADPEAAQVAAAAKMNTNGCGARRARAAPRIVPSHAAVGAVGAEK